MAGFVGCWWLAEKDSIIWSGLLLLDCLGIGPFTHRSRFGGSRGVLASASLGLVGVGSYFGDVAQW